MLGHEEPSCAVQDLRGSVCAPDSSGRLVCGVWVRARAVSGVCGWSRLRAGWLVAGGGGGHPQGWSGGFGKNKFPPELAQRVGSQTGGPAAVC